MFELTNQQFLAVQQQAESDRHDLRHIAFHRDIETVATNHIKSLLSVKMEVMPCLYPLPEPHTEPTLCTLVAYHTGDEPRVIPIPHPREFSDGLVLEYIDELQRVYEDDERYDAH